MSFKNDTPKADKSLGQHFLRDQKVIQGICKDYAEECDVIVEVGPGPATLTRDLAAIGKPFYLIEKDTRFKDMLEAHVDSDKIFFTDALEFNWPKFIQDNDLDGKKIWLVSNLPYNVGTVLFTQFLGVEQIKYMSLMFQKEVGDKTYIRQEKNQMNGLLFLSINYFNSKQLLKVAPGCFAPPPKVDSVVVSYERKEEPKVPVANYKKLDKFTRNLFNFRRKQLGSVLKKVYPKDLVNSALESNQIDNKRRAETLTYDEVLGLFNAIIK